MKELYLLVIVLKFDAEIFRNKNAVGQKLKSDINFRNWLRQSWKLIVGTLKVFLSILQPRENDFEYLSTFCLYDSQTIPLNVTLPLPPSINVV